MGGSIVRILADGTPLDIKTTKLKQLFLKDTTFFRRKLRHKQLVGIAGIPRIAATGDLMLGSFEDKLCLCDWAAESHRDIVDRRLRKVLKAGYEKSTSDVILEAMSQLDEYFNGERTVFEVPLLFVGTEFQKSVWYKLLEIPYGSTVSYGELAKQLDLPKAVRAVAAANGANAISIFAPCHRVIGSNRTLVGYGGGLPAKKRLLDLELNGKPLL